MSGAASATAELLRRATEGRQSVVITNQGDVR